MFLEKNPFAKQMNVYARESDDITEIERMGRPEKLMLALTIATVAHMGALAVLGRPISALSMLAFALAWTCWVIARAANDWLDAHRPKTDDHADERRQP